MTIDKLYSEEQIKEWADKRADDAGRLSRQLLDTMRENERLLEMIKEYHSDMQNEAGEHYLESELGEKAIGLLQRNKHTLPGDPYCIHGKYTGNSEQCPKCLDLL